jgi:hypothetical protein
LGKTAPTALNKTSVAPPAAQETMISTGLEGYLSWAEEIAAVPKKITIAIVTTAHFFMTPSF